MKKIFIILLTTIFYSCSSGVAENSGQSTVIVDRPKTQQELKDELLNLEMSQPLNYLTLSDEIMHPVDKQVRHSTWFRSEIREPDGVNIECSVNNSASLATYKDVLIKVDYISATNSIISSEEFRVFEYFPAGRRVLINKHLYPPVETNSFKATILKAKSSK